MRSAEHVYTQNTGKGQGWTGIVRFTFLDKCESVFFPVVFSSSQSKGIIFYGHHLMTGEPMGEERGDNKNS